jgi:hypothetical protein
MTVVSAALQLFLVMDPLGNIPFFLSALSRVDPRRQRTVVVRELLIALSVLTLFLFAGRYLLELPRGLSDHHPDRLLASVRAVVPPAEANRPPRPAFATPCATLSTLTSWASMAHPRPSTGSGPGHHVHLPRPARPPMHRQPDAPPMIVGLGSASSVTTERGTSGRTVCTRSAHRGGLADEIWRIGHEICGFLRRAREKPSGVKLCATSQVKETSTW